MIDYNQLAADYARYRRVHPGVLQELASGAGLGRKSRVLEVGCGTGNYIIALAESLGCKCWGLEPSEQMLSKARKRSQLVLFLSGSAEKLGVPEASFDLVFSVDVIHHVGDPGAHYREAYRALAPGGKVCTITDSEAIIRTRVPLSVYFPETVEADLQRYPGIGRLREWMLDAGFSGFQETEVAFPYERADIEIYRWKAYSCLHLISDMGFQEGIKRLEQDLLKGPIPCVAQYVLVWGEKPLQDGQIDLQ